MPNSNEKISSKTPVAQDRSLFSTRWILEGGHEAHVDYDEEVYHQLLDDMDIGPERDSLSVVFTDYIPVFNNSNPLGHYRAGELTILVRVFNRQGIRYMLTKDLSQKPLHPKKVNETLIHETRHFFQHMGALAVGEEFEWKGIKARTKVERDAKRYTRANRERYPIVKSIGLGSRLT